MYYGRINKNDIANGIGVRVSLFVSGCRNHCKNCFNPETWNFKYGKVFDEEAKNVIIEALNHPWINGFTILGGEPFEEENQLVLVDLVKEVRKKFPNKTIWMYTGYLLDKDILPNDGIKHTTVTYDILSNIDVLVDGKFIDELKNLSLKFKGSENQRIIDVPKTLKTKQLQLVCLD